VFLALAFFPLRIRELSPCNFLVYLPTGFFVQTGWVRIVPFHDPYLLYSGVCCCFERRDRLYHDSPHTSFPVTASCPFMSSLSSPFFHLSIRFPPRAAEAVVPVLRGKFPCYRAPSRLVPPCAHRSRARCTAPFRAATVARNALIPFLP